MASPQETAAKYVYGVVRARRGSRPRLAGIYDKPVKVVARDGLGALVSDVPDGPIDAGRDELLAHSHVLERALERGVVLPMRFGVVMPSEQAVREALGAKRAEDGRGLVDRLLPHALAVEVGNAVHERMAANASFLVARDRLAEFDRAVNELGAEQAGRIRLKYTGPLPPHSFVELAVEA